MIGDSLANARSDLHARQRAQRQVAKKKQRVANRHYVEIDKTKQADLKMDDSKKIEKKHLRDIV